MHYKFIYDEEQIKLFHSLLSPLKDDESYFVYLVARNKYLSQEERHIINIGKTDMFDDRKLVKSSNVEAFINTIKRYETQSGIYTSRVNVPIPEKCFVVYVNINPVSGRKALKEFYKRNTQLLFDIADGGDVTNKLLNLDTELMSCYQRARGTKKFVDIDFDIPEIDLVKNVCSDLKSHKSIYHVIKTKNGFHVLVQKDTLEYNYTEIVNDAHKEAKSIYGEHCEVIINNYEMIPVPGTIQSGHNVCIIGV